MFTRTEKCSFEPYVGVQERTGRFVEHHIFSREQKSTYFEPCA
jgi:hypothetical protein